MPLARRLLIAIAACTALAVTPGLASAKSNLQVGFLDNDYAGTYPQDFWPNAVQLKVGFMRWDIQWGAMAVTKPANPRNPEDPAYHFAQTDQFVQAAAAHGLQDRIMFTVWRTPTWATKATKAKTAQMPNLKDWRDFVAAVATRYSGTYVAPGQTTPLPRVVAWETWNEPNGSFAFMPQKQNGKFVSPANYVKLLNALKSEVNKAVPFKPTFVAGAMYKQGSPSNPSPIEFMRGMKAAGAKFDVLSMHPYNNTPRLGIKDGATQSRTNPNFIGVGNFDTFITLANQIFGKKYPIWITEFGLPTTAPGKTQYAASFKQQATFAYDAITRLKALPQVERAAWFLVRDNPPAVGAWYTTGLEKVSGQDKPSYQSWIAAATRLQTSPIK